MTGQRSRILWLPTSAGSPKRQHARFRKDKSSRFCARDGRQYAEIHIFLTKEFSRNDTTKNAQKPLHVAQIHPLVKLYIVAQKTTKRVLTKGGRGDIILSVAASDGAERARTRTGSKGTRATRRHLKTIQKQGRERRQSNSESKKALTKGRGRALAS